MIASYLLPTTILLGASFFDIKSRKVPNNFILGSLLVALLFIVFFSPLNKLDALLSLATSLLITFPLWFIGALGAGDAKVFAVFGLLTNTQTVIQVFIFSIFIAALLGITKSILDGSALVFIENFKRIILFQKPESSALSKIPFTVALLLGWICFLTYDYYGRLT